MGVLSAVRWVSKVLWTLPAPTDTWASIIGDLAWPFVVVFLVIRFRRYLRSFLDTIAARLVTDHVKLGPFELTPNSNVIVLDPDDANESTEDYAPDDIYRMERLFEFIADTPNFVRLSKWVDENVLETLEIADFVTLPEYANERERAYAALVEEKK